MAKFIIIPTKEYSDFLKVNTNLIQEVVILEYGNKYRVKLTLSSGHTYYLIDNKGNDIFDNLNDAESIVAHLEADISES